MDTALQWLEATPKLISLDFEVASIFTDEQKEVMKEQLETETDWYKKTELRRNVLSTGLNYGLRVPYMCGIGLSRDSAFVIILPDNDIRSAICEKLTELDRLFIMHNAAYDMQIIHEITGKFLSQYEDTMLLAKCLTNHVEKSKCQVGLKELNKAYYGNWAIAKDNFNLKCMYDEDSINYNAIDAAATYYLYERIMESL